MKDTYFCSFSVGFNYVITFKKLLEVFRAFTICYTTVNKNFFLQVESTHTPKVEDSKADVPVVGETIKSDENFVHKPAESITQKLQVSSAQL